MNAVFSGLNPHHCFELWVQFQNLNYRQLVRQPDGSVLDLARPTEAQSVGMSIVPLAEQLAALPALEYLPDKPRSVNWHGWDWQKMTLKPAGYTEVNLVVLARTHNPETDLARVWWAAGSLIPNEPDKEAIFIGNRLDHYNWVTAPVETVLAFLESAHSP